MERKCALRVAVSCAVYQYQWSGPQTAITTTRRAGNARHASPVFRMSDFLSGWLQKMRFDTGKHSSSLVCDLGVAYWRGFANDHQLKSIGTRQFLRRHRSAAVPTRSLPTDTAISESRVNCSPVLATTTRAGPGIGTVDLCRFRRKLLKRFAWLVAHWPLAAAAS